MTTEAWLCKRAAAGDQRAFEQLWLANRRKLLGTVATYTGSDTTAADLAQVVAEKLWREIQAGRYNPARAPFAHFASTIAHQSLRDDALRRRAAKRWGPAPPVALDMVRDGDGEDGEDGTWRAPSAWQALDPLRVVLAREELRLAWSALAEHRRRALNRWLQADGGNRPAGLTASQVTMAADARKDGRRALDELRAA